MATTLYDFTRARSGRSGPSDADPGPSRGDRAVCGPVTSGEGPASSDRSGAHRSAPGPSTGPGAHLGCPACEPIEGEGPCGLCQERGVVECYGDRDPRGILRTAVLRRISPSGTFRVEVWHRCPARLVGRMPAWTTEGEARVAYRGEVAAIVAATVVH